MYIMNSRHAIFNFFSKLFFALLLLLSSTKIMHSQVLHENSVYELGSLEDFVNPLVDSNFKLKEPQKINIQVNPQKAFVINIETNGCKKDKYYLFGKVEGFQNATFFFRGDANGIKGKLLFYEEKEAYLVFTGKNKEVFIKKVDIDSQVCIMENIAPVGDTQKKKNFKRKIKSEGLMPELESFPGAPGVLYLDFDGENVSGGGWGRINASPSGLSNKEIEEIFYIVSEDYAPFNINVTTKRSVYNNANRFSRQMIIFNNTYPNNPGVALFNSFSDGSGDPCWVKMGGPVQSALKAANVGSHEAGHTFRLSHDGSPSGAYYPGHSFYRVIMGTVTNGYSQFSKGEYSNANNKEDDLKILSGNSNRVGFRTDDHGNSINSSSDLEIESNGEVLDSKNFGIIGKTTDVDLFKMEVGSGMLALEVRPANKYNYSQNLDLKIRLLDASGVEMATANGNGFAASSLSETVVAGTYYLEVDGVGEGSPLGNGYSDYGSLGQFFISGQVPPKSLFVGDLKNKATFHVFPNPTNGKINIQHGFLKANYEVVSLLGEIVSKGMLGNRQVKLDLSFLTKGLYLFNLKTDNQIYTSKIIIK